MWDFLQVEDRKYVWHESPFCHRNVLYSDWFHYFLENKTYSNRKSSACNSSVHSVLWYFDLEKKIDKGKLLATGWADLVLRNPFIQTRPRIQTKFTDCVFSITSLEVVNSFWFFVLKHFFSNELSLSLLFIRHTDEIFISWGIWSKRIQVDPMKLAAQGNDHESPPISHSIKFVNWKCWGFIRDPFTRNSHQLLVPPE